VPPPPPPAAHPAPAMEATANANLSHEIVNPDTFESRPFVREEQSRASARVQPTTMQHERMASSWSEENKERDKMRQYLQQLKEKAQMEFVVHKQSLAVKSFCRKKKWTWKLMRVCKYVHLHISCLSLFACKLFDTLYVSFDFLHRSRESTKLSLESRRMRLCSR
jgi:hypothetical protein